MPAGLVEEVKALAHPPIAWDVELTQWFAILNQHDMIARLAAQA